MNFGKLWAVMERIVCFRYYIISFCLVLFLGYLFYFFFLMNVSSNFLDYVDFIGHGIYGIDNITYTNSKDSLEVAYKNGIRVIEVDFLFTNDGELVLNHIWDEDGSVSYNEFMHGVINDKYTPMDLKMLFECMRKYDDLYVVIDTKEELYDNEKEIFDVYEKIVNEAYLYDVSLLDRFIVQLYNFKDYKLLNKIYKP